jgi:hypothetical protein
MRRSARYTLSAWRTMAGAGLPDETSPRSRLQTGLAIFLRDSRSRPNMKHTGQAIRDAAEKGGYKYPWWRVTDLEHNEGYNALRMRGLTEHLSVTGGARWAENPLRCGRGALAVGSAVERGRCGKAARFQG